MTSRELNLIRYRGTLLKACGGLDRAGIRRRMMVEHKINCLGWLGVPRSIGARRGYWRALLPRHLHWVDIPLNSTLNNSDLLPFALPLLGICIRSIGWRPLARNSRFSSFKYGMKYCRSFLPVQDAPVLPQLVEAGFFIFII